MASAGSHNAAMPSARSKSFDHPDQVRQFAHGRFEVVELGETSIGRLVYQPGWRWSVEVRPLVGTPSCQLRHLGVVTSGRLGVLLDDGTTFEVGPGDVYEIPPGHDGYVIGDETFMSTEFASARTYGAAPEGSDERILATILFTDIVDSTASLARLGDTAWRRILLEHNDRLRAELDRFRGIEVDTTGDGFLARFDGAARAVRCAAAMVTAVTDLGIQIRAGLHTGEIILSGGNVRGIAVHAAARISALAGPDEVLVSGTTLELLDGSGLEFTDRGAHELKGLTGARQIYALVPPPA
jgi:class 3 adenylate cyclase